jgi:short-subunit dehydrogenase
MASRHKPIDKQVIVITGASSGIGLCTALLAAERGARVVLAARSGEVLREVQRHIVGNGGQAACLVTDVCRREDLDRLAAFAVATYGGIDTWVNNAGVAIYGRLDEVSEEDSRQLFDINFWGVVNGSLAALPYLKTAGGALVNLGSEVSDAVIPLQGMYSASKHAVKGFTDALRVELEDVAKLPVTITLIQPTAVNTPYPEHARNYMAQEPQLPTPRIAPEKVAEAILEAAVDGGRDIKVGAMASLNTATSKLLPSLADKLSAMQAKRQQKDRPPAQPRGALYQASDDGRVHGLGSR